MIIAKRVPEPPIHLFWERSKLVVGAKARFHVANLDVLVVTS